MATLLFVGDVMLGRQVNETLKREAPEYPWGDTLPFFKSVQWRMCNLECVISDRGVPWNATPKVFHFRSDAKNIVALRAAHLDVAALANNHTLDYEYEAMFEMIDILDAAGIRHAGAGMTLETAGEPAISEVDGVRIGAIAFTDNEPSWRATQQRPGIFYVPIHDVESDQCAWLANLVRRTKPSVDILVVSAHWGSNWGHEPPIEHISFAHKLIDAGADVIFGHSAHVFRGIELYKDRPIMYSTGDFIDDYAIDALERNDESFLFCLESGQRTPVRLRLYPTVICNFQAALAKADRATTISERMQALCQKLGTNSHWDVDIPIA